jgi:hypothetical protein
MDTPTALYADPRRVDSLDDCWFYHTTDVPGHGTVQGNWDLRGHVDEYLGGVSWAGKRVLELGTASGFFCFEMEARGAEVVAFDLAPGLAPDILPVASHHDLGELTRGLAGLMERLRNSYWLCHRLHGSRAKVVYGNIYELPAGIGPVDVATFGSILLHLRDPFLALANAVRFARESIVVTDVFHQNEWDARVLATGYLPAAATPPASPVTLAGRVRRRLARALVGPAPAPPAPPAVSVPAQVFLPDPADPTLIHRMNSWWQFSPAVIQRFLGVLGFGDSTVTTHSQTFDKDNRIRLFTVVARRTAPMPKRTDGPFPWY